MVITTEYLGEIEYKSDDIIKMERGIYGFENLKDYLLIEHPDENMPYMWLQSTAEKNTYFIVTNPFYFVEDYDFDLSESVVEKLGIDGVDDMAILSLVVIPESIDETTINLQSPIIMNKRLMKAEQVILDENFPLKYRLFAKGVE